MTDNRQTKENQERQFDEAARMIRSGLSSNAEILIANTLVAAVQGQAGQAAEYQDQYLNSHGPSDRRALVFAAWRGDRNDSNHLAGKMDAREFGHLALLQAIDECHCGAPFDLESTPSFAAFIAAGQLPWPPADSIAFPLKNW
jgi:hypothetical protein